MPGKFTPKTPGPFWKNASKNVRKSKQGLRKVKQTLRTGKKALAHPKLGRI